MAEVGECCSHMEVAVGCCRHVEAVLVCCSHGALVLGRRWSRLEWRRQKVEVQGVGALGADWAISSKG